MTVTELQEHIRSRDQVVVELGCGPNKQEGVIGVDSLPLKGVDYVCDLEDGLPFLEDNSVDEIRSRHLLEHIERFEPLMLDVHRVLKPGGRHVVVVPHFSNPFYYSDYTHRRFFGLYTFDYFGGAGSAMKRKVPAFYTDIRFQVIERRLVFKSVFFVRNLFKQVLNRVFNLNAYMQELYEESFCYIFPCQEMRFVMVPLGKDVQNGAAALEMAQR